MTEDRNLKALPRLARFYELVREMELIVSELRPMGVEVEMSPYVDRKDPLGRFAAIRITMVVGAEYADRQ